MGLADTSSKRRLWLSRGSIRTTSSMRISLGHKCRQQERRLYAIQGEVLLDAVSKTTPAVAEEYAHYTEGTWSSKGMLELIRQKMSAAALDSDDRPSTSTSSPLGKLPSIPQDCMRGVPRQ